MKPTLPSRSASSRFADALRATGYGARPSAFRTSRRSRSRFLSAATAVVLVTSVIYAFTAIFTHASADASSYQDWPMFLQNPARTAATIDPKLSVSSAATLKLKFAFATGGPIASSVSIVGTTAYVGAWDGYEYAVNTQTGALIWKQFLGITTDPGCNPVNIGITSSAAIVNGVLYVGGGGPYWYALDPATGNILWKVYTGDNSQAGAHYNWSSPLIVGNYAYIGIASNCDNPLVQGQLLQVAISGRAAGPDRQHLQLRAQRRGRRRRLDDADLRPGDQHDLRVHRHAQRPHADPVAGDRRPERDHAAVRELLAASLRGVGPRLRLGHNATLTTDAAGDQLLSVANKNGILYTFNRNNLAAGPVWQHQVAIGGICPTCGDGTIASGIFANGTLYYAGGSNVQNGPGRAGRSPPSTRAPARAVEPPDRGPDPGLARLRQRHDRPGARAPPSRCSTPPTASCCTPT